MKITATNHDATSAIATIQKMPPAYSPTAELAKPIGRKPAAVTSVPVSIGNAVDSQAKDAARTRSQPCSIFTTIISTAMMASSTSRPSAMISAPSVMRCRSIDIAFMTMKTIASTSGTDSATTMPVRQPSDRKLTNSTIASASMKECTNSPTACSTTFGWSAICSTSMPCGTAFMKSLVALLDVLAELEDVGALGGDDADAERGLAFLARHEGRRIDEAVGDGGDIAEPEHAAVALDRRLGHRLGAVERAGDAQRHALRGGFDGAGRRDVVLLGERIEQRLRRDAERRQLGVRELDEDALVLGAVEIDLGDAGHLQQPLAHALGGLLQLRVVGAVAGHHVEDGIDVAEFVVDGRAEQAGGQLALHVGELLAQQVEQVRHVLRRRRSP